MLTYLYRHLYGVARLGAILGLALLGASCGQLQPFAENDPAVLSLDERSFGRRPAIEEPDTLHRLTPAQERDFLAYWHDPGLSRLSEEFRLFQYLERFTDGFIYENETAIASHVLASGTGNCMSLAVLTTALAQAAGLEYGYQLMDDAPIYELNGAMVKKGVHIRSTIYRPLTADKTWFYRPGVIIDYFPTQRERFVANIDYDDYLAMYYQNRSAESLESGDLDTAYWLAREALRFAPRSAPAINLLAVINRRAGHQDTADAIYRYGIARADEKLTLMKNYHTMLVAQGRDEEARQLQFELNTMDDPSPIHWYQLARTSYDNGDFREAIRFFDRALEIAPYLHEAHLGIAQSNYRLGRLTRSEFSLKQAIDNVSKVSTKKLYRAKLATLSREIAGQ